MGSLSAPTVAIVGGGPSGLSLAALLEKYGVKDYIVYERSDRETIPRGACLDLHPGSGQKVFKEIGAFEDLKKYGRWGEATRHIIANRHLEHLFEFGEGRDAPEVDRSDIRKMLLGRIPEGKVRFKAGVDSAERDENGQIVLTLSDGTTASGFKLVIGADGAFSKIRHLVTPAELVYSGHTIITTCISPSNPQYEKTKAAVTMGNMAICGLGNCIWSAPQGKGIFRWDLTVPVPSDFPENAEIDLSDPEANKKFFLQDKFFGTFAAEVQEAIRASEGDWRPWRLFYMPPDCFDWPTHADVTLIGDAAHATTPWVGDGVNCAMRDALILSKSLQELGVTQDAVSAYEKEMFVWASDLIRRSIFSGEMFLEKDNPTRLAEFNMLPRIFVYDSVKLAELTLLDQQMKTSIGDLIGHTDNV